MKLVFLFTVIFPICVAAYESVYFQAMGENIQGPISSKQESDGVNYFLIGSGAYGEVFDLEDDGTASTIQGEDKGYVGVYGSYLAVGLAVQATKFVSTERVLDNFNFWACKNTGDPQGYSVDNYIIAVNPADDTTAPFKECSPIDIVIDEDS